MQSAAETAVPAPPQPEPWQDDFSTIYRSGRFDHLWYAARYPDVGLTDLSPPVPPQLEPWQDDFSTIYRSGRFDHLWYAARYPDVGLTDLSPLEHYVKYGARLGRQPRAAFPARP